MSRSLLLRVYVSTMVAKNTAALNAPGSLFEDHLASSGNTVQGNTLLGLQGHWQNSICGSQQLEGA